MARTKKSRKISDIMPVRKADKKPQSHEVVKGGKNRKPTRYELDAAARLAKKKKKRKGLTSGSRHSEATDNKQNLANAKKDSRIGSRKKIPLVVEFVNKPEQGKTIQPVKPVVEEKKPLDPYLELEQLENNEILNELLDSVEAGKALSKDDQKFVDDCLDRIDELMEELGIEDEVDEENDLFRQFETANLNEYK